MSIFKRHNKQEIISEPVEAFPPDETAFETNNPDVKRILNKMSDSKVNFIATFSKEFKSEQFPETPDLEKLDPSLAFQEAEDLRRYTGIEYKYVNSVLRGFWNFSAFFGKNLLFFCLFFG